MVLDKIKELEALRAKIAVLADQVAAARNQELLALPAQYGFDSVASFIAAVRAASGKKRGRPARKVQGPNIAASKGKPRRRRRAKITDIVRSEVKKLVSDGKSGAEIAKTLRISLPSVQNIKKALGLVKERKK